jgi:hypothetical protein
LFTPLLIQEFREATLCLQQLEIGFAMDWLEMYHKRQCEWKRYSFLTKALSIFDSPLVIKYDQLVSATNSLRPDSQLASHRAWPITQKASYTLI